MRFVTLIAAALLAVTGASVALAEAQTTTSSTVAIECCRG
jgi:hypothetical protein